MTEQETLELLERRLRKLEAQEACRNLMGKYSYYHTAFRNRDYIDLWAKRDDDLLKMPWGSYHGFEGVKACYMNDHGDRSDPAVYEQLKGSVMMHEMDTEIIEVAEDGLTARAAFLSQGHETYVEREESSVGIKTRDGSGVKHAEWCWGKYAVDFILDSDGVWRIWHMRLYPLFKAEYGASYVDAAQPVPGDYTFTSGELNKTMWHYSPDELYPGNEPEPPKAYRTFADDGVTF